MAHNRQQYGQCGSSGPALRQPVFNWKAPDKYLELWNVEIGVINTLQIKVYELNNEENFPIEGPKRCHWGKQWTNFSLGLEGEEAKGTESRIRKHKVYKRFWLNNKI